MIFLRQKNNLRRTRMVSSFNNVEEIAKSVGISQSYYYKIEQGVRIPGVDLAKKIADQFDSNVDDLFFKQYVDISSR